MKEKIRLQGEKAEGHSKRGVLVEEGGRHRRRLKACSTRQGKERGKIGKRWRKLPDEKSRETRGGERHVFPSKIGVPYGSSKRRERDAHAKFPGEKPPSMKGGGEACSGFAAGPLQKKKKKKKKS